MMKQDSHFSWIPYIVVDFSFFIKMAIFTAVGTAIYLRKNESNKMLPHQKLHVLLAVSSSVRSLR